MRTRWRRRRGADGERGAVMIEMAIVAIVLMILLAATFDFGMGFRSGLSTMEAARAGARIGSGAKATQTADFFLLTGLRSTLASSGLLDDVEMVAIFKSPNANGTVPPGCKTGTSGTCNVLTGQQLRDLAATHTGNINGSGCVTNATRRAWCPTDRNDVQADADYLGVWVRVEHDTMFRFTSDSFTVERTSIMRLEPRED